MASASPLPPTPPAQPQGKEQQQQKAVAMNALRLLAIGDRLRSHFRGGATVLEPADLAHLVYAFARGIDFALSSGDVPIVASDIPGILKKVYLIGKDQLLQSSVMVLMISCKNACSQNWFQPTDCTDILRMANELSGNFCTPASKPDNESTVIQIMSTIIPRYYPQLKFERLVTSLEAKAGYDVLMADFFIHKNVPREEKINLIVVQKEDLDASSCIANPPHVSFLVNGKGVDKRTNVSMETGPLFPTDITRLLKYGANIIQAIGYFNANYIIAVAFLNKLESFDAPNLNDYAQPVTADPPDSDILEGPSRVSLKCPISFRRIKTPIKGCLCKHYQCFDYDNYMEMNLRKPTWRCPCCNTPSNFTDLRIDQKMAKILQETGEDTIDVLVFADGSWKAVSTHDERSDKHSSDVIQQSGDTMDTDATPDDVIDLINEDDGGDAAMSFASASEDVKPLLNYQDLSVADYLSDLPMNTVSQAEDVHAGGGNNERGNVTSTSGQNSSLPSTGGLGSSSFGTLESILPHNILHPVITDAVSPSLDTSNSVVPRQNVPQGTHSDVVRLQPRIDPLLGLEIARPPIPRNVRRDPIGVQALPVQPQRVRPNIYNCPPPFPQSSPASSAYQAHHVTNSDTVITAINSGVGSLSRTPDATSLLQRQLTQQDMRNTQNYHQAIIGITAPQNFMRPPPGGLFQSIGANALGVSPAQQSHHIDRLLANNLLNQLGQAAVVQASTTPPQVLPTQPGSTSTISSQIRTHFLPAQRSQAMRPTQAAPRPTISQAPSRLQPPFSPAAARPLSTPPPIGTSDDLPELPVDESWRPSGQMRGSLTGEAYSVAIGRYTPNVNIAGQQTNVVTSQARPAGPDARR
ncbi:E4 SUMO-protein ligase PIAL2-like [Oryza brachyantha]|uniref:SP-RING-type domain-containing protein n=1 Tax=Oryza brachyantha TaxID=4533 RepID=J3MBK2_ORYBR|nr:E4 SUMO-protein ligase PIAL2-like [Oryza brachyantha]